MSTTPYEPSFPPSRQDYRELIDHHYLIRGLTVAPLILLPIAIKTSAQYGPLSMWTGIGMNLSILLTCLQFLILRPCLRHPHPHPPTRSQWFTGGTSYNNISSCASMMAPSTPSPSPPESRTSPSCWASFIRSTKAASSTPTRRR